MKLKLKRPLSLMKIGYQTGFRCVNRQTKSVSSKTTRSRFAQHLPFRRCRCSQVDSITPSLIQPNSIGVNLGVFEVFCNSLSTDAEEIRRNTQVIRRNTQKPQAKPSKQINPTGLKRVLEYKRFVPKIRRGCKPHLPGKLRKS